MKRGFDPIYTIINPDYHQGTSGGQVIDKPTYPSGTTYGDGDGNEYYYWTVDDGVDQNGWYDINDHYYGPDPDPSWTPVP